MKLQEKLYNEYCAEIRACGMTLGQFCQWSGVRYSTFTKINRGNPTIGLLQEVHDKIQELKESK